MKGRKLSEEIKKKISKSNIDRYFKNFNLRKKLSDRIKGCKNPLWKNGISKIDRLIRGMSEYLQWRSDIFERDNWICQTCRKNGCYLTVHHIKGIHKIIVENNIRNTEEAKNCKELWDTNNGVTLCEYCHSLTDNYKGHSKNKNKKLK